LHILSDCKYFEILRGRGRGRGRSPLHINIQYRKVTLSRKSRFCTRLAVYSSYDVPYVDVLIVSAAGDMDHYSCDVSPARAHGVIAVAAIAYPSLLPIPNSNFGSCIDLFAPGQNLSSAWPAVTTIRKFVQGLDHPLRLPLYQDWLL